MSKKVHHHLAITEANHWQADLHNRKGLAAQLTAALDGFAKPLTLSLDGPWGTGKTTFLKLWEKDLQAGGYPFIYFNAWEHDYCEDPLMSFVFRLTQKSRDQRGGTLSETAQKFFNGTAAALKVIAKKYGAEPLAQFLVQAATTASAGIIDGKVIDATIAGVTKDPNALGKQAEARYQQIKDELACMDELKKLFREMAEEIVGDTGKPLVILIDELDRCKPSWAVGLLEAIKHLFSSSDKVVFVVATDRTQLGHAIAGLYGSNFDGQTYLRRFLDLEIRLPEPNMEQLVKTHWERIRSQLDRSERDANIEVEFTEFLVDMLGTMGFTFRDANQYFAKASGLVLRSAQSLYPESFSADCFEFFALAIQMQDDRLFLDLMAFESDRHQQWEKMSERWRFSHRFWKPMKGHFGTTPEMLPSWIEAQWIKLVSSPDLVRLRQIHSDYMRSPTEYREKMEGSPEIRYLRDLCAFFGRNESSSRRREKQKFDDWMQMIHFSSSLSLVA